MQVVEVREWPRQVFVDEFERAAKALETDLQKDARGILDVFACRLHQPRRLTQLGEDAPRPFGQRGVLEDCLAGEAGRQHFGVGLRAALPGANLFELEEARADGRFERRFLEPLDVGQPAGVDGRQPSAETAKGADLRVDGLAAVILEEVVVKMNAVEGRIRWVDLVQVGEVLVNEVGQGFG